MTSDRGGKERIFVRTSRLGAVLQNRGGLCAWFNALADPAKARAILAASDPGPRVHPEVIAVMGEPGFDLSGAPTTKPTRSWLAALDVDHHGVRRAVSGRSEREAG